jgi:hypothetical protein
MGRYYGAMTDPASYPVRVTARNGEYTLRIEELLLVVRDRDLGEAYRQLVARQRQLVEWAAKVASRDELPPPRRPGLTRVFGPPRQGVRAILHRKRPSAERSSRGQ